MSENRTMVGRAAGKPFLLLAIACAIGAGALTGCSSSTAGTAATGQPSSAMSMPSTTGGSMSATATTIMIENFSYATPGSVGPGATVSVMNMDGDAHTVTSDTDGAFAVTVSASSTATFTAPATAGTYDFHCDYHSNMHGTLVVK
jgi:plastocyanin